MAKLYFYFSAMNAGKSTVLLQSAYNYQEQGMHVLMYTSALDDRYQKGQVSSRIGLRSDAEVFHAKTDLYQQIRPRVPKEKLCCILVDEAQFLSRAQVEQLANVVDTCKIPVLCYGLRTDFRGDLFEGSQYLLAWAEELVEIKTICSCGRKATMNARVADSGTLLLSGDQIEIGGNERYESMCRRCYQGKKCASQQKDTAAVVQPE